MNSNSLNVILPKEYEDGLSETVVTILRDSFERVIQQTNREFISLNEAKEYTNTTYATLMKWVNKKGLSMYKIDGKVYFSMNDINDFIRHHEI